ncbi:unnamed protein product [marine sediment metagenome]|uniref:Uncharacterized protein n=1 Tax=marine sediment metagenome TaxID=412755 RepID=X1M6E9_9ZZZZ
MLFGQQLNMTMPLSMIRKLLIDASFIIPPSPVWPVSLTAMLTMLFARERQKE